MEVIIRTILLAYYFLVKALCFLSWTGMKMRSPGYKRWAV